MANSYDDLYDFVKDPKEDFDEAKGILSLGESITSTKSFLLRLSKQFNRKNSTELFRKENLNDTEPSKFMQIFHHAK